MKIGIAIPLRGKRLVEREMLGKGYHLHTYLLETREDVQNIEEKLKKFRLYPIGVTTTTRTSFPQKGCVDLSTLAWVEFRSSDTSSQVIRNN